ncbi:hypothetical protein [Salipaludibacillus keqinensis]|uniref:hypothetical protein n=1 Tax=Salipaludibacillus keqinensis TaxID=2045207 RepID=UPI0013047E31|nr:hypothetical protein [Salipaludibacillus keqinensis]
MGNATWKQMVTTAIIGAMGGCIFYLGSLPLPWLLGSMTMLVLWQGIYKRKLSAPKYLKNIGFVLVGMYFAFFVTNCPNRTLAANSL